MADNGTNMGNINVQLGLDSSKFKQGLDDAKSQGNAFGSSLQSSIKGIMTGAVAGFSLAAITNQLKENYLAAEEAEKIERQLAQTLRATGFSAQLTQGELIAYASELQDLTGVNDEVIKSGENILLTFGNINGSVFKEATRLALDLSTTMGTDLNSAIVQIGKALNDPIRGMTALQRVGVAFTNQQKDQVKELVRSGQALKAQQIILKELETEFGGAAQAARTSTMVITTQLDDLREELGRLVGTENAVTKWAANLISSWKELAYRTRIFNTEIKNLSISELQDRLPDLYGKQQKLNEQIKNSHGLFGTNIGNMKNYYQQQKSSVDSSINSIENQIMLLSKQENAEKQLGKTQAQSFNTGKEKAQKAQKSEAQTEYESFLKTYQGYNNDYLSLKLAREKITAYDAKTDTAGLQRIGAEKEEYDTKLKIYQDYYKNVLEITQSKTANKAQHLI